MITTQPKTMPNGVARGQRRRRVPAGKIVLALAVVLVAVAVLFRLFVYAPTVAVVPAHAGAVHQVVTAEGTVQTRLEVNVGSKVTGVPNRLFVDRATLSSVGSCSRRSRARMSPRGSPLRRRLYTRQT
jgi:hypothetical protein